MKGYYEKAIYCIKLSTLNFKVSTFNFYERVMQEFLFTTFHAAEKTAAEGRTGEGSRASRLTGSVDR